MVDIDPSLAPCGTCGRVECYCDEETMALMEREREDRE